MSGRGASVGLVHGQLSARDTRRIDMPVMTSSNLRWAWWVAVLAMVLPLGAAAQHLEGSNSALSEGADTSSNSLEWQTSGDGAESAFEGSALLNAIREVCPDCQAGPGVPGIPGGIPTTVNPSVPVTPGGVSPSSPGVSGGPVQNVFVTKSDGLSPQARERILDAIKPICQDCVVTLGSERISISRFAAPQSGFGVPGGPGGIPAE